MKRQLPWQCQLRRDVSSGVIFHLHTRPHAKLHGRCSRLDAGTSKPQQLRLTFRGAARGASLSRERRAPRRPTYGLRTADVPALVGWLCSQCCGSRAGAGTGRAGHRARVVNGTYGTVEMMRVVRLIGLRELIFRCRRCAHQLVFRAAARDVRWSGLVPPRGPIHVALTRSADLYRHHTWSRPSYPSL